VGSVLVVWSDSVLSVMKQIFCNDWPQAHIGWQIEGLFRMIPEGSTVTVISFGLKKIDRRQLCQESQTH
jgi:hypothetical protein